MNYRACQFSQSEAEQRCRFLAVAYHNGIVVVRKAENGNIICVIDDERDIAKNSLAFSRDDAGLLVVATASGVNVYHAQVSVVPCHVIQSSRWRGIHEAAWNRPSSQSIVLSSESPCRAVVPSCILPIPAACLCDMSYSVRHLTVVFLLP